MGSSCPHSSSMTLFVTVCPCFCPHQTFLYKCCPQFSIVQFSCSVVSDSLPPHGLQYGQASLSITNSQSLLKLVSIESVMPSNHLILFRPLLLPPSIFPVSGSFPMSQFFTPCGQSIGISASASVLPMNIQD